MTDTPSPLADAHTVRKLARFIDDGFPISVGKHSYGGPNLHWSKGDFKHSLTIGAFCSIADDVSIFVGKHGRHHIDYVSSYPLTYVFGKSANLVSSRYQAANLSVHIGNDVWIGRGAMVMAGVTIGDGAVIGARAVVVKDVAPYSIVGGVPAKLIRMHFEQAIVNKLLKLCWWDWDDAIIKERLDFFSTPNFEFFLDHLSDSKDSGKKKFDFDELLNEGRKIASLSGRDGVVWPSSLIQRAYTGADGEVLLTRTVEFIEKLIDAIPLIETGEWKALDYGAGFGRIASLINLFGSPIQLTCSDAWESSLQLFKASGMSNPTLLLDARLTQASLPKAEFDFAYAYSVFTHLPHDVFLNNLEQIMDSLKPKGVFVFTIREPNFIDFLRRSGKLSAVDVNLENDGFWFGNAQSGDYGDTVVTWAWLKDNVGRFGELTSLGIASSEPYQLIVSITKNHSDLLEG